MRILRECHHINRKASAAAISITLLLFFGRTPAFSQSWPDIQDLPITCRLSRYLTNAYTVAPPFETKQHKSPLPSKQRDKYDISRIGSRPIGRGLNFYSLESEYALGKNLSKDIESQLHIITEPAINEYVQRFATNLANHSDAKLPFTIRVFDDDEVNAFSFPGGFLFISSGLLTACENEAELAGVLAHEIAHVAARHATRNETRKQLLGMAALPLSFVGGSAAFAVSQAFALAQPIVSSKFSRNAEREADLLGIQYAYVSGYDPAEFVHFFERYLQSSPESKPSLTTKLFASHPLTADRIHRTQNQIATTLPARQEYVVTTSEFEEIKATLSELRSSSSTEKPTLRRSQEHSDNE